MISTQVLPRNWMRIGDDPRPDGQGLLRITE